ncbi:hypothetical protein RQP46_007483 [Phenoliferia psychrophenolica]
MLQGYQRANLLSAEDVALIQRVTGQKAQAEAILAAEGEVYASLYIRLLNKLSRADTVQSLLSLISDMLQDHDERISLFLALPDSPYTPLLKLLDSQDDFVRLKSSVITSTFLASDPKPSDQVVSKLLFHLSGLIRNTNDVEGQDVGVQCLEAILAVHKVRTAVWAAEDDGSDAPKVTEGLVQLLRTNPTSQMQYQLAFCFWLLTYDPIIAASLNHKYNVIPLLTDLARNAVKEKVIRVVVAIFRNLVVKAPSENLAAMLVAKLLPFVKSLASRKWSDDEIKEDVDFLVEELKVSFEGLTTYDEYTSELESGMLEWSPPHKSEEFWKENANRLNEKDRKQLKNLVKLLVSSKDSLVLAVAANDIAQYAKFCDTGKRALEDLGAKGRVMELMAHPDPDVKYNALVATQTLISSGFK